MSFHFLFFLFLQRLFTSGQAKGNVSDGQSRHQSFRVCKVYLATRKVATNCRSVLSEVQQRPTKNVTSRPPCTAPPRAKKTCRNGLRVCCAKEHKHGVLHIVLTLLIGERPAILIVCGPWIVGSFFMKKE